jgi:hypothetical protein
VKTRREANAAEQVLIGEVALGCAGFNLPLANPCCNEKTRLLSKDQGLTRFQTVPEVIDGVFNPLLKAYPRFPIQDFPGSRDVRLADFGVIDRQRAILDAG